MTLSQKAGVSLEYLFENKQEPPPALAVHRRESLFGVLLWCEEESCVETRLRPRVLYN